MNIPFSPPDISDLEVEEVSLALKSGWITTGPRVKKLEKLLAEYVGVPTEAPNCVCLNSQTACGELSLRLLGIGPQEGGSDLDEVITCAYTYTASASVVCHVGAKLVLIDCQKDSLEMDYDALEEAINEHTKAIIPIDLGGVPCDYDRILEIVNRKKHLFKPTNKLQAAIGRVAIVEDAAHYAFRIPRISSATFTVPATIEQGASNVIVSPSAVVIIPPASSIITDAAA